MNRLLNTALIAGWISFSVTLLGCEPTDENPANTQPIVSTAGQNGVYFSTNRSGNYELVRLNDDFGAETLQYLTVDSRYDSWWPRQSPDGRSMLFYRSLVSDRPETGGHNNNYSRAALWSLDLQSQIVTELIPAGAYNWNAQGVADWSPDGSRLVMAAIEGSTNRWHLYTTDPEGGNAIKITSRSSLFLDPSWSPDGTQIVYVAFPPDYHGIDLSRLEVFVADANGQNERRLTDDGMRDHDPYWSPDGRTIAFETAVDPLFAGVGKWAIRTVDTQTGVVNSLLDDGNINTLPRWSDDGNTIFFHRFIFGSGHGFIVARMNADGTGYRAVTLGGDYDDTDLDWFRPVPPG